LECYWNGQRCVGAQMLEIIKGAGKDLIGGF